MNKKGYGKQRDRSCTGTKVGELSSGQGFPSVVVMKYRVKSQSILNFIPKQLYPREPFKDFTEK